ncbi:MAG: hypothetical protein D6806_07755 [Deltaproteobacteria bacterium]|nr:MAG: hypothetical protein D6806_07755 [Deltaproteobacteria bacterium]
MHIFLFVALIALPAAGCGSACRELADKICECQPTRAKQDRCRASVSAADSNIDASDSQEDFCQQILDSGRCTCEALEAGQYASCGLSNDPLAVFE